MAIEDIVVRRELTLPVDRETVWAMLVDPEELAGWLADEVELEIEVGAEGWLRSGDGEPRRATVEEVVEGRRVVLRWSASDDPETIVELTLDDAPEGTRLVVLEVPTMHLEAVGISLEQAMRVICDPGLGSPRGPQMVATLA
jgi:uncharacterized protein YndB with AHSA1/START domain